jgi:hypothetical protein
MDYQLDPKLTPATLALIETHEARQTEIGHLQATIATLECEQIHAARPLITALTSDLGLAIGDRIHIVSNTGIELGQYRITDFRSNCRAPFVTLIGEEILPDGQIGVRYSWVIGLANSVKITKVEEPCAA